MDSETKRDWLELFDLSLVVKAIFSAAEIVGGVVVLFVSRALIVHIADLVTEGELSRDPNDFIASTIRETAHGLTVHAHYVLAAYLLARGVLKLGLITLILRGHRLAYPFFIVMLAVFGSYEAYRAVLTTNLLLGSVALFDTFLILITAYEYQQRHA